MDWTVHEKEALIPHPVPLITSLIKQETIKGKMVLYSRKSKKNLRRNKRTREHGIENIITNYSVSWLTSVSLGSAVSVIGSSPGNE